MAYRTILVYFGKEAHARQTLALAVGMARRCNAHLIGLFVIPEVRIEGAVAVHIPATVLETLKDQDRQEAARIKALFEENVAGESFVAEWRCIEAKGPDRVAGVLEHARMADLVVLSQADKANDGRDYRELPDRVIMESGRPVLMAPLAGEFAGAGDYVMVAWDGGRESARATFDALPLLAAATQVYIHSIARSERGGKQELLPGAELSTSLARHNVSVEAGHSVNKGVSVGDELLARAADRGCTLLVMGGYGHSRLSEVILGGVTRHMLDHMTIPVLLSH
jgi:nucleotide-binding universal stress UspA family protein